MTSNKSVIFSCGLTTGTILDILKSNDDGSLHRVAGIIDDDTSKFGHLFYGKQVIGNLESVPLLFQREKVSEFILGLAAVKHIALRDKIFKNFCNLGLKPFNCISNKAYLSENAVIGKGILILPFSLIGSLSVLGDNVEIDASVSILERCVINNNVHISSNCFVGGMCEVGQNTYVGPGSTIASGVKIGANSIIGAGSIVMKDVPEGVMGYGNPFKVQKENRYFYQ
jgi:sugar O-acyltransferase (sialic acid O-acetyltransferase NeuD family)